MNTVSVYVFFTAKYYIHVAPDERGYQLIDCLISP